MIRNFPRGTLMPFLFACTVTLGVLLPLMMMVTISLNPDEQDILVSMGSLKSFIPETVSFQNYIDLWTDPARPFFRYMMNTAIVTVATLLISITINSMAAFVVAQGSLPGNKMVLLFVVATIAVPAESLVLPQLILAGKLGLVDSYVVQILPGIANALSIFLFFQFFSRIPKDLFEAAELDGFSFFQKYRHIALPLSKPVISAVAILQFLEMWNAYLWPVMVTRGPEVRPLTVAMGAFFGTNQRIPWGDVMAFAVSMAVPVILFFLLMQRQFIASVMSSGVKG
jgi:multiple sugar transport system permease protein